MMRWTRTYGAPLREAFPVEEAPADELMGLLEYADQRRRQHTPSGETDR